MGRALRLATMGVPVGGGGAALSRLLTLFAGAPGGDVAVRRESDTVYQLMQAIGGGRYWSVRFSEQAVAGSVSLYVLGAAKTQLVWQSVDDADPSVTKGGGSWSSAAGATLGGTYAYSNSAGSYAEYTTPDDTVHIGARAYVTTVCGMWLVTIDGDNTLANQLPTAQDLVTLGTLESTALIANGGTLNPTDRIYDSYVAAGAASADWRVNFALDLDPGVHTIRITRTGYKNPAASEARIMFTGFTYSQQTGNLSGSNLLFENETSQLSVAHEYEYAFNCKPTGASADAWVGNGHGYDSQSALEFKVDDSVVTPAVGEVAAGTEVKITRTTALTHPDIAPTKVADAVTIYTLTVASGLQIDWTITWALDGTMTSDVVCMYPVDDAFDTGANVAAPQTIVSLTADDDTRVLNGQSQAIYMWDADGIYGHLLYIADLASVDNWTNPGTYFLFAFDFSTPAINKMYAYRNASGFSALDVWISSTQRRIQRFPDGANAVLSTI